MTTNAYASLLANVLAHEPRYEPKFQTLTRQERSTQRRKRITESLSQSGRERAGPPPYARRESPFWNKGRTIYDACSKGSLSPSPRTSSQDSEPEEAKRESSGRGERNVQAVYQSEIEFTLEKHG
ncbi:hypothetical protein L218DRAFT_952357 [Marasmius fiardii PR-910]|nr:hypothetical protein L218DRAFT_952357 [Marasmius fiardii PR-910]